MKSLTSRNRVLKALNHEEPDRVPIDMGSTIVTGIMAHALDCLRKYLGLSKKLVKVYEVFQMLGEVEIDVIERFNIDVLPIKPLEYFFGLRVDNFKPWKLWDEKEVLVPWQFNVEVDSNGNWLLHTQGDPKKPVEGKMPKGGYYFDILSLGMYRENFTPPPLKEIKKENHISTNELTYIADRAEKLRKTTDKALVLDLLKIGIGNSVGSIPNFLMLLYTNRKYMKELFKIRTKTAIENLEKLKKYLNNNIDIIALEGQDYAGQNREFFSPHIYEEVFLPYFKMQNDWIHQNTNWKTFQHICGSIVNFLPLIVESGVDILNPIQTSAAGMDPKWLKDNFGKKLTFWGGGVDTQKILPFGSMKEVVEDVKERIRIFAPGGGYIFNTIHNIQQGTPPEKIVAVFDTIKRFGVYPIN